CHGWKLDRNAVSVSVGGGEEAVWGWDLVRSLGSGGWIGGGSAKVWESTVRKMSVGSSYASSRLENNRMPDKFPVGMKVLLVDDDLTCLAVVKRMLLHCQYDEQGSPFQSVPPSTGGMYRSDKILVRGSLAIGQYYRKRPSAIDFGHRRSISIVGGQFRSSAVNFDRWWSIKGEKREILALPRFPTRSVARGRFFAGGLLRSGRRGENEEGNSPCRNEVMPRLPARGEGGTRRRLVSPVLFF
ncbi:hypothetical protein GW17_00037433, partial [Ensete ventricosum]